MLQFQLLLPEIEYSFEFNSCFIEFLMVMRGQRLIDSPLLIPPHIPNLEMILHLKLYNYY